MLSPHSNRIRSSIFLCTKIQPLIETIVISHIVNWTCIIFHSCVGALLRSTRPSLLFQNFLYRQRSSGSLLSFLLIALAATSLWQVCHFFRNYYTRDIIIPVLGSYLRMAFRCGIFEGCVCWCLSHLKMVKCE